MSPATAGPCSHAALLFRQDEEGQAGPSGQCSFLSLTQKPHSRGAGQEPALAGGVVTGTGCSSRPLPDAAPAGDTAPCTAACHDPGLGASPCRRSSRHGRRRLALACASTGEAGCGRGREGAKEVAPSRGRLDPGGPPCCWRHCPPRECGDWCNAGVTGGCGDRSRRAGQQHPALQQGLGPATLQPLPAPRGPDPGPGPPGRCQQRARRPGMCCLRGQRRNGGVAGTAWALQVADRWFGGCQSSPSPVPQAGLMCWDRPGGPGPAWLGARASPGSGGHGVCGRFWLVCSPTIHHPQPCGRETVICTRSHRGVTPRRAPGQPPGHSPSVDSARALGHCALSLGQRRSRPGGGVIPVSCARL